LSNGKTVILSGPSGVGKDTVIDRWTIRNPRVSRVVAYTTRPPRPHESEGRDYHFVSTDRFQEHARAGDFLEYKEVHGNYYATPLKDLDLLLEGGKVAVLKIDVQGALTAMSLRPEAISVFLLPPSAEELERRLSGRGTEDPAAVVRRMENARNEMALADRYRHRIVNEDLERVVEPLEDTVGD
jgi:guanylate kinase